MNILPTSSDANGFKKYTEQNCGWELQLNRKEGSMEELLRRTVLDGMIELIDVPEDFEWMSDTIKQQYTITGSRQWRDIKAKLDGQKNYDSDEDEVLEGDTGVPSSLHLNYYPITEGPNEGTIEFWVTNEKSLIDEPVIIGYPIDKITRLRIPRGFKKARKFLPIALFSPTSGGKSTLLASLLAKGLKDLPVEYRHQMAHWENTKDYVCDWYKNQAEMMLAGKCPAPTQATKKVPPVFIELDVPEEGESIIVGIYDFSGEVLEKDGPGYKIVRLLQYMKGIIYLVGPEVIQGFEEGNHIETADTSYNDMPVTILSLEEQAKYQKRKGNKRVKGLNAKSTVNTSGTVRNKSSKKSDEFYDKVIMHIGKERLSHTHLAFVVAQCDRLEGHNCISDYAGIDDLFIHDSQNPDLYQTDDESATEFDALLDLEEDFITEKVLSKREKARFEAFHTDRAGRHVSYHMVSATGCSCTEIRGSNGELLEGSFPSDKYDPIRVAEPFLVCIREMLKNGMYYED